jgi:hypothetical protein
MSNNNNSITYIHIAISNSSWGENNLSLSSLNGINSKFQLGSEDRLMKLEARIVHEGRNSLSAHGNSFGFQQVIGESPSRSEDGAGGDKDKDKDKDRDNNGSGKSELKRSSSSPGTGPPEVKRMRMTEVRV